LRLARRHVLGGPIEGLADIAGGTRESIGHLPRGFVHEIGDAPPGLGLHFRLAPFQTLPAARDFGELRLPLADAGQLLVALLHGRLGLASADE
jgi:hypothetical protein